VNFVILNALYWIEPHHLIAVTNHKPIAGALRFPMIMSVFAPSAAACWTNLMLDPSVVRHLLQETRDTCLENTGSFENSGSYCGGALAPYFERLNKLLAKLSLGGDV
jgi:hypothetical protein